MSLPIFEPPKEMWVVGVHVAGSEEDIGKMIRQVEAAYGEVVK